MAGVWLMLLDYVCRLTWALDFSVYKAITRVVIRHDLGAEADFDTMRRVLSKAAAAEVKAAMRAQETGEDGEGFDVSGPVATVPIVGIIAKGMSNIERASHNGTSVEAVQANLRAALAAPSVKSILLYVNSPGGTTDGLADTADLIATVNKQKPVVAFIDDVGASAGYWLAAPASRVIVSQTAQVGNVGVYAVLTDETGTDEIEGRKVHVVRSGIYKGVAEDEITDEQLSHAQMIVDALAGTFFQQVKKGRGLTVAQLKDVSAGRVFVGKGAVAAGLADEVGTITDAMRITTRVGRSGKRAELTDALSGNDATQQLQGVARMESDESETNTAHANATAAAGAGDGDAANTADAAKTNTTASAARGATTTAGGGVPNPAEVIAAAASESSAGTVDAGAVADDKVRVQAIANLGQRFGVDPAKTMAAMTGTTSVESFQAAILADMHAAAQPVEHVVVGTDLNLESFVPAAVDSILVRNNVPCAEPHPRHTEFMGRTLLDIADDHLSMFNVPTRKMRPHERATMVMKPASYMPPTLAFGGGGVGGHTTSHFPAILRDATGKSVEAGYGEAPQTWPAWMRRRRGITDFKQVRVIKLGEFPALAHVPEGGTYEYATVGEFEEVYTVAKYGRKISITWEAIVNDDQDGLSAMPMRMGFAAARLETAIAYGPLINTLLGAVMGDSVSLFDAAHNNLLTGGAITVANLAIANTALRLQTGISGTVKIDVPMSYLIVPATLEIGAKQLIASVNDPAITAPTPNPFNQQSNIKPLQVISDAILDTDADYPGAKSTGWYVATNPAGSSHLEVGTLEGYERPSITEIAEGDVDGITYKVRHVIGAAAADFRGIQYNPGP